MKQTSIFSVLTVRKCLLVFSSSVLLLILQTAISYAQPSIIAAALADNVIMGPGANGYTNASSIDYGPFNAGGGPVNPQLTAVVTGAGPNGAGVGAPQLWIGDQVTTQQIPILSVFPAPIPTPFSPTDVAVGNDIAVFGAGQYYIGVVYLAPSGLGNDVFLNIYTTTGTGGVLAAPVLLSTTNISLTTNAVGAPHIDAIAEYSNPFPAFGGLPRVVRFVITWQEFNQGIYAYSSTFNAPAAGVPTLINPNRLAHLPDVAAVQRQKPSGAFENWALFSFVQNISAIDFDNLYLIYQEWNITQNQVRPLDVYDIKPYVDSEFVRIDAIDDYHFNNPGNDVWGQFGPPASNSFFCIATTAHNSNGSDILSYTNIAGKWNSSNISAPPGLGGQRNRCPVVACGPGQNYSVGYHSTTYVSGYAPYFATSINWATGRPNTPGNAYAIPTTAYGISPAQDGLALAATSNTNGLGFQSVFASWQNNNQIYAKYTNTVAYSFKGGSGNPSSVAGVTLKGYEVMPNPATDYILLQGSDNTFAQCRYQISDITGRTLLQASITNANERVDIHGLANGIYILNIYNEESQVNTFRLVKQ